MLKDPEWLVRDCAVGALATLNPPDLAECLQPMLEDANGDVRRDAKSAIDEAHAVNAVVKLGGRVERADKVPGQPVIGVVMTYNSVVTAPDLKVLKEFKGLRELMLDYSKITDAGLKELGDLKGLRDLHLSSAEVTDAGLKELKGLSGLQTLELNGNKITDAGLKDLKELKGLKELDIWGTQITDAGLKDLKELKGLREALDRQQ